MKTKKLWGKICCIFGFHESYNLKFLGTHEGHYFYKCVHCNHRQNNSGLDINNELRHPDDR